MRQSPTGTSELDLGNMDDEEALFVDFENYNNGETKRHNVNNLPPDP